MRPELKIYVNRLEGGKGETIEESFPATLLFENEAELHFPGDVSFKGQAYLADGHLVIKLEIHCAIEIPCSICDKPCPLSVDLKDFYYAHSLEEVKAAVFDYSEVIREAVLLELPAIAECDGRCKQREEMRPFLAAPEEDIHFPFKGL